VPIPATRRRFSTQTSGPEAGGAGGGSQPTANVSCTPVQFAWIVASLEDKIVQPPLVTIPNAIYEVVQHRVADPRIHRLIP
jgi:hypothetical protein